MDPTPPTPGSRIQHLGDRLIVRFRPRREWGSLAFLTLWLTLWTVGGLAALGALGSASWGERPFLLLWLCGWAAGEAAVFVIVAWQLRGRELLIVTPEQFEIRQELWSFTRTKLYETARVQTVEAARVPHDEDEKPRKDFCLKVIDEDKSFRVGEGMTEQEAEEVAATVREFIRPRSWWGEEDEPERSVQVWRPATEETHRGALLGAIVAALLAAVTVWAFVYDAHKQSQTRPAAPTTPQLRNDAVLTYASAMTHQALMSSGTIPLERPACRGDGTVAHWVCTVSARSSAPPFAGRTMLYRCEAMASGTRCGPARQPPLGG